MVFVGYLLVYVYLTIYMQQQAHMSRAAVTLSTSLTILMAIVALPCFSLLSDRIGRRPVIAGSGIGLLILPLPMFGLINSGSIGLAVLAQVVLGLCVAAIMGVPWAAIVELFYGRTLQRRRLRLHSRRSPGRRYDAVHSCVADTRHRQRQRACLSAHGVGCRNLTHAARDARDFWARSACVTQRVSLR